MDRFSKMVIELQGDLLADLTEKGMINTERFLQVELCLSNAATEARILAQPDDHLTKLLNYVQQLKMKCYEKGNLYTGSDPGHDQLL